MGGLVHCTSYPAWDPSSHMCRTAGRASAERASAGAAPPLPAHQDARVEPVLVWGALVDGGGVGWGVRGGWGWGRVLGGSTACTIAAWKHVRLQPLTLYCCARGARRCVLDAMFDERHFRVKPAFLRGEAALRKRFRCGEVVRGGGGVGCGVVSSGGGGDSVWDVSLCCPYSFNRRPQRCRTSPCLRLCPPPPPPSHRSTPPPHPLPAWGHTLTG